MEKACAYTWFNIIMNNVADRAQVMRSDLFESFRKLNTKFDLIIDDVSGMSDRVSRISSWYKSKKIPTGDEDGTEPTVRMLGEVEIYLKPGGVLYFPVLSLANHNRIIEKAEQVFGRIGENGLVEIINKWFPFPNKFIENMEILEQEKEKGNVSYKKKGLRYLWNLRIFRACI